MRMFNGTRVNGNFAYIFFAKACICHMYVHVAIARYARFLVFSSYIATVIISVGTSHGYRCKIRTATKRILRLTIVSRDYACIPLYAIRGKRGRDDYANLYIWHSGRSSVIIAVRFIRDNCNATNT